MSNSGPRLRLLVSLVVLTPLPIVVAAHAAASCSGVHGKGQWASIDLPAAASQSPGPGGLETGSVYPVFAAARRTQDLVVTSAGRTAVYYSPDAGCTWRKAFDLSAQAGVAGQLLADSNYRFTAISYADPRSGVHPTVYGAITDDDDAYDTRMGPASPSASSQYSYPPMFLAVSDNGGASWHLAADPATPADMLDTSRHPNCRMARLGVGSGQPVPVAVDCSVNDEPDGEAVYVSRDQGEHWSRTASQGRPEANYMPASGFTADTTMPTTLWTVGQLTTSKPDGTSSTSITAFRSVDDGDHWRPTSLRATKLVDSNLTGWATYVTTAGIRAKTIVVSSPYAAYLSRHHGTAWRMTEPFGSAAASVDDEGIALPDPHSVLALAAVPHRSWDGGTTVLRNYCGLLRDRHYLLQLNRKLAWSPVGADSPEAKGSADFYVQPGLASRPVVYALAVTSVDPTNCPNSGFTSRLVRFRVPR